MGVYFMEEKSISTESSQWRTKTLTTGAIIGALIGIGAAYLLVQKADREHGKLNMGASEGIKLGMMVLGLLRQISQLHDAN